MFATMKGPSTAAADYASDEDDAELGPKRPESNVSEFLLCLHMWFQGAVGTSCVCTALSDMPLPVPSTLLGNCWPAAECAPVPTMLLMHIRHVLLLESAGAGMRGLTFAATAGGCQVAGGLVHDQCRACSDGCRLACNINCSSCPDGAFRR